MAAVLWLKFRLQSHENFSGETFDHPKCFHEASVVSRELEFLVVYPNSPENAAQLWVSTTRTHVIDLRRAKLKLMFEFRMQILCFASFSAHFRRILLQSEHLLLW